MVVLEGGGMLSSASNQYLQPDYLSPLPTTVSLVTGTISVAYLDTQLSYHYIH